MGGEGGADPSDGKFEGGGVEVEAVVAGGKASIFPIGGTCSRTGVAAVDAAAVQSLVVDPKEARRLRYQDHLKKWPKGSQRIKPSAKGKKTAPSSGA